MSLKLYEITGLMSQLNDMMEAEDADNQSIIDTLDSLEILLEDKLEGIAKYYKNLMAEAKMFDEEAKRLAQRAKALENRAESLKNYAQNCMEQAKIEKVKAGLFNIRLQANPASVEVIDEAKVADKYKIPQPDKMDKKAMLEDMKNGIKVEGAKLVNDKKHLRF